MREFQVEPFHHPWSWFREDSWERWDVEGVLTNSGPVRVDPDGVIRVQMVRKMKFLIQEDGEAPRTVDRAWPTDVVLATGVEAVDPERVAAFWRALTMCWASLDGELLSELSERLFDSDVDLFGRSELSTWEDFCMALTERAHMGEALGEAYWSPRVPVWFRAEALSCFPMGGDRAYLDLAIRPNSAPWYTSSMELVARDRREIWGSVRLYLHDEDGDLRECREQHIQLAQSSRVLDLRRVLTGLRAHAAVLEALDAEVFEDLLPYELWFPSVLDLKRAHTQQDFEVALRAQSRFGRWLGR